MTDNTSERVKELIKSKGRYGKKNMSLSGIVKKFFFAVNLIFFIYSVFIYVYATVDTDFAEIYSVTVSAIFREILAYFSSFIPFSLAETIVVAGTLFFVFMLVRAIVLQFYYKEKGRLVKFFFKLVCVVLVAVSLFINTFGVCYKRHKMADIIGIDTENLRNEDIALTAFLCSEISSKLSNDVTRLHTGETVMPYSFEEMVEKIHTGYNYILKNLPDKISVKPVALSKPWTYTHISGMYFPFTGESNVNVNFPDFIVAFSCAHEIAHQLGFASEDEANFMAFLACAYSDDSYLMYCAYVNALDYLISDLDANTARLVNRSLDRRILLEYVSYSDFMKEYHNKVISDISSGFNNAYLMVNGVENGTKSYGEVTKLISGFMKKVYPEYYEISD